MAEESGGDAMQVAMRSRWRCTAGGDAQQVVMHSRWRYTAGDDEDGNEDARRIRTVY